jgi:phosphatidylserine/phosphatidylglycerophosphate/cardiolipin synthase-like enzyme
MTSGAAALAEAIRRVTAEFPRALVDSLAGALTTASGAGAAALAIERAIPQPHYRALALDLIGSWKNHVPEMAPQSVAFALVAAAHVEEHGRHSQRLELVWTGPEVEAVTPRRTEQALLQVIDTATNRLTVVSFVAYKVPSVAAALAAAARRGVAVRLIVEDPEVSQGKVAFDALKGLGLDVAERSEVFVWPMDKRPKDGEGRYGSLHAKCAVADARLLLISSANLTGYAFTLNLELGTLIHGGALPAQVAGYFDRLVDSRTLIRIG